jgi:hypothetical protein
VEFERRRIKCLASIAQVTTKLIRWYIVFNNVTVFFGWNGTLFCFQLYMGILHESDSYNHRYVLANTDAAALMNFASPFTILPWYGSQNVYFCWVKLYHYLFIPFFSNKVFPSTMIYLVGNCGFKNIHHCFIEAFKILMLSISKGSRWVTKVMACCFDRDVISLSFGWLLAIIQNCILKISRRITAAAVTGPAETTDRLHRFQIQERSFWK